MKHSPAKRTNSQLQEAKQTTAVDYSKLIRRVTDYCKSHASRKDEQMLLCRNQICKRRNIVYEKRFRVETL